MPPEEGPGVGIPLTPYSFGHIPSISSQLVPRFKLKTFTFFISVVDICMFIATLAYAAGTDRRVFVASNTMAGPGSDVLGDMGAKWEPCIRAGEAYRLATPIVLHAGILHICMNLYFQFYYGFTFELRWTWRRLAAIYFISGVGATLLSSVASPQSISVGASGALAGMIGADITYLAMNWSSIPQNTGEACNLFCTILLQIMFGVAPAVDGQSNSIDNFAHLGGLLTGIFCGACLCPPLQVQPKTALYQGIGSFLTGVYFLTMLLLIYLKPEDPFCRCTDQRGSHTFYCGAS